MSRFKKRDFRRKGNTTFSLNITSMTDMFTLLLVFLLQNYATTVVEMDVDGKVVLPQSSTMKEPTPGPQVLVSETAIKVDGKVVLDLENGNVKSSDLDPRNKSIVMPLFEILQTKAKEMEERNKGAEPSSVILHADFKKNMGSLEPYFTTISAAGFAKVKLATVLGR
jgi:biopolymer transport protein ExbD